MENALTREMIRKRRASAQQAIQQGRDELADCDAADRLLDSFGVPKEGDLLFSQEETDKFVKKGLAQIKIGNPFRLGSIKGLIWQALYEGPEVWVDANWVQKKASAIKGNPIPMASISPNLSQMKGEYLVRDNLRVALKSRLNENGEAEASPDAGGGATPPSE